MKSSMLVLILLMFILISQFFVFPVHASAETRYMRSDQQTINGLTAYKLGTTQTTSSLGVSISATTTSMCYAGIRVWKRASGGIETEITNGLQVALVSRSSGEGLQSNTWSCPENYLETTDAIIVRIYLKSGGGTWVLKATFITEQIGGQSLSASTWTVYYYTSKEVEPETEEIIYCFYFGTSTYNSRIDNFMLETYTPPTTSIVASPNVTTTQGSNFLLNITINDVANLYAWSINFKFRQIIDIVNVIQDTSFFDGTMFLHTSNTVSYYRTLCIGCSLTGNVSGKDGSGRVAYINFIALYNGTTTIDITRTQLLNSSITAISHTSSSCSVTVSGTPTQYFLDVEQPSYGNLNVTSGVHDNGTNVVIKATETTGVFQYIKVDDIFYTTKTVIVTMDVDHKVSASFQIPTLTINTEPNADIWVGSIKYKSGTSGTIVLQKSMGTYAIKVVKPNFYDNKTSVTMDANKTLEIKLYKVQYRGDVPETSKVVTLSATIYFPDYIDYNMLIYCEPLPSTTAKLKIILRYGTDYPIIEVESQNMTYLKFNIATLYDYYAKESYQQKITNTFFTGLKIDSNCNMAIEIQGIEKPRELWKLAPGQNSPTKLTNWSHSNNSLLINFVAGDPTLSILFPFPSGINPSVLVMFQVVLPIIALVGFAFTFIKSRPETIRDIVLYAMAFIIMGVVIPVAINMIVNG